ncbi:DUF3422 family protein [Rhizobium ruizarguesonis]
MADEVHGKNSSDGRQDAVGAQVHQDWRLKRASSEIEYQNATQIRALAERAVTQVKIQRATEGFSIIAISYSVS